MMRLVQGDCYKVLKEIPDKTVDLVVMDPPYKIGTTGAGMYAQEKKRYVTELDSMKEGFSRELLDDLCRVMKSINLYVFCTLRQIPMLLDYFVKGKGCYWNLLTWHKTNPVPACNNKYLSDTEYICFFREPGVHIGGSYETKKTFFVTPCNVKDKRTYNHPTVKPENIIQSMIENSSKAGDTVIDPFMGSGTTGAVCAKTQRNFIGIEKNPQYFATAKERIYQVKRN